MYLETYLEVRNLRFSQQWP